MRLYTSNFSVFIVKSLLLFLVVVVLYAVTIGLLKPTSTFAQNQSQGNFIFAQNFIYLDEKPSQVIVGSSMAARMKFEKEDDVYNLAFDGGGPLTGMEIIRRSGFVPKVIYIESNVFSMDVDEKFLDKLFTPLLFELRREVIALQEKYQLLNIVGTLIYGFAGRSQQEKLEQQVDTELLDMLVISSLQSSKQFSVREMALEQWHKNLDYFQAKGTKILFFEMPNDRRLITTNKRKKLRKLLADQFPKISYIEENNSDDKYKTADGTHLTLVSALAFTRYVKKNILTIKER